MGGMVVWLVGAHPGPGHTPLAALAPLSSDERGGSCLVAFRGRGLWLFGW